MWKWIIAVLVLLALGAGGIGAWLFAFGGMATIKTGMTGMTGAPTGVEVRLEEAKRGDLVRTVNAPGAIEPQTSVKISAQVSSRIIALPFQEGDTVRKGDVVVRLDAQVVMARLDAAKSQLAVQEAQLDGVRASLALAEADVGRWRELFGTKDIAKSELEATEARYLQAKSALAAAEAGLLVARAEIAEREKDLANTVIAAPIDGTIVAGDLKDRVGSSVKLGDPLMQIAQLSDMVVVTKVDDRDIKLIQDLQEAGAPVVGEIATKAYPGEPFSFTVERIVPLSQAEQGVNAFEVRGRLDRSAPWMRPGMEGQARFDTGRRTLLDIGTRRIINTVRLWLWW